MKKNDKTLLLVGGGAALLYFLSKKQAAAGNNTSLFGTIGQDLGLWAGNYAAGGYGASNSPYYIPSGSITGV